MSAAANVAHPEASEERDAPGPVSSGPKNPWGSASGAPAAAPSLAEVMSEQLASDLQAKDIRQWPSHVGTEHTLPEKAFFDAEDMKEDVDCQDDLLIAQMLQMQYDKEFDQVTK